MIESEDPQLEGWKMVKTLLLVFMVLGTACAQRSYYAEPISTAADRAQYAEHVARYDPCAHIDPLLERLKHAYCKSDSAPTTYDIDVLNQQGYENVRRQVRRKWRRSAFNNPYLRYNELQNFHEQSHKDHHE
jgi:hypothetical protein